MSKICKKTTITLMIFTMIITNLIVFFVPNSVQAAYNQVIINANSNNNNGVDAFPQSYKERIAKLSAMHPNWKFKAFYTDISWNELTSMSAENACYKNTVYKGNDSRWYCSSSKHKTDGSGSDGYYCASGKIVNYYLDPRNFLTEATIFQFLELSYNESTNTIANIQKALSGSFMEGNTPQGESYAKVIQDAAKASGENAFSIIVKIYQEIGKGSPGNPPRMVSGKDGTYPNTYNFYNYGATDGSGAQLRGLAYANSVGWHDARTALVEGAKLISSTYIKNGQNTKYLFKFNVVANGKYSLYNHQYMTNIQDPTNQAILLYNRYDNYDLMNEQLTFVIPIYKDMPTYIKLPSTLSGDNLYYISSSHDSVGFRTGPGANYSRTEIAKDTLVKMIDKNAASGWCKVQKEDGTVGYVSSDYLTPVNNTKDTYSVPSQPLDDNANSGGSTSNSGTGNNQFKIDGDKIITEPDTTLSDVKSKYTVKDATKDGKTIVDNSKIGTGTVITIDNKKYTVVKMGDVSGDGLIDARDASRILKYSVGTYKIENEYKQASDISKDGAVDARDASRILKYSINQFKIDL